MAVKMMLECVKLLFSYTKYTIRMSKTLIFPSKNAHVIQEVYLYPNEQPIKCLKKKPLKRLP